MSDTFITDIECRRLHLFQNMLKLYVTPLFLQYVCVFVYLLMALGYERDVFMTQ